ncbi:enoyl-CoA hydratase/isomerase family protein [Bradyrhizobium sp. LHD-71]|uniref:enoyl-CoA hydratase/isomerase family protein n=1 Tax=Bradyrhizobium sp. LHD-71 TaxID=3072141 RepID=UPI00280D73CA|nr:enoyl-CoA hydratase/isomerase family protein [Bradyrhizobium sp. LHD-71]MDQ8728021.1 enoyl-CoA hydratase/isomerase family protein [Bradyrhizobium sp. LHD-71]
MQAEQWFGLFELFMGRLVHNIGATMKIPLQVDIQDGIASVLINHPPVNAITPAMLDALMSTLRQLGNDPDIKAIVIGSAIPGRYCGGLDLPQFRKNSPAEAHAIITRLYLQLHELQSSLPKPTIAAITGAVRGGGMSIAITCDMLVAAENTTFAYPEMDVGLLPAIHYTHLPRIVGRYRAFDLLFTGRVFSADEAMQLGLVNRVVPEPQVLNEARGIARALATKSPQLMRVGKAAFVHATDNGYRSGAAGAVNLIGTVIGMDDSQEGLAAFEQKRRPVWGKG